MMLSFNKRIQHFCIYSTLALSLACTAPTEEKQTVVEQSLKSIVVNPVNPTLSRGIPTQLTADGVYTGNESKDISAEVIWSVSDESCADINSEGKITGSDICKVIATASSEGISGNTLIEFTNAQPASIKIFPSEYNLALGAERQLLGVVIFSDNTSEDLSSELVWSTEDKNILSVNEDGIITGKGIGETKVNVNFHTVSTQSTVTVGDVELITLSVSPGTPVAGIGSVINFTVQGTYSDGSVQDLTSSVKWTISPSEVATIEKDGANKGRATFVSQGNAFLKASSGNIESNKSFAVTSVVLDSITILPSNQSFAAGVSQQFKAIGYYSDDTTSDLTDSVSWSSSDSAQIVFSVTPMGEATFSGTTNATLYANYLNQVTGSTAVSITEAAPISISINPSDTSTDDGLTISYQALGSYTDGLDRDITSLVDWSSPDENNLIIIDRTSGNEGNVKAILPGSTTITAIHQASGLEATSDLLIKVSSPASIQIDPNASISLKPGEQHQFTASLVYTDGSTQNVTEAVTWTSSDPTTIASISDTTGDKGLLSSVNGGTLTITAFHPATGLQKQITIFAGLFYGGSIQGNALTLAETISTFAGMGQSGFVDGSADIARFDRPHGITTDGLALFVADSFNNAIRKIDLNTGYVTTVAGGQMGTNDGTGSEAQFYYPRGITTDGTYVFVTDYGSHRIRSVKISTGEVSTLAGSVLGYENGPGVDAKFKFPRGITYAAGYLYVTDRNNRLRKIDLADNSVSEILYIGSDPTAMIHNGAYLMYAKSYYLKKVDLFSPVTVLNIGPGSGTVMKNGGYYATGYGITTDGEYLYVATSTYYSKKIHRIKILDGEDTVLAPEVWGYGIVTDGTNLYVADTDNHRIQKIQ